MPEDYLIKDNENRVCIMGIYPDDYETNLITIGSEVMKSFSTIFNF